MHFTPRQRVLMLLTVLLGMLLPSATIQGNNTIASFSSPSPLVADDGGSTGKPTGG
jgi:hypothetical protein